MAADWSPEKVSFFADGKWIVDIDDTRFIPKVAGKMIVSHWSNGQPLWSGGPPEGDAKIVISYVKAYFNSTDPTRHYDHYMRCTDRTTRQIICPIPNQMGPPNHEVYFFYKDGYKAINQSIYGKTVNTGNASSPRGKTIWITTILTAIYYWL